MTTKLGYCIHCGQANITCINTAKDGTMTHYSVAKQGECGPLMIDDVEIPEPNWKALARPAPADGALREVLDKIADIVNRRLAEPGEKDETETLVRIGTVVDAYLSPPSSWPTNEAESEAEANVHSATCPRCFLSFTCTGGCNE